jgi:membrane associated rhomboid family serine protease
MSLLNDLKANFERHGLLTKIIAINIAVFLTVNVVGNLSHLNLLQYLALPIGGEAFIYKFWTLFTYMFTHVGLMHLFFNLLTFYFMAQVFFTIMGEKKMLYLYVMSGLCGGALVIISALIFPQAFGAAYLIGASASVLGVGAVMAVYSPNYRVYLFGAFALPYKYFFGIMFVLSTIIDLSVNTGGKIAHIGGAAFGLLYGFYLKRGTDLFELSLFKSRPKKLKVVSRNQAPNSPRPSASDDERMNSLLDKISTSGYDSLTKSEKEELFRLSQKK